MKYKIHLLSTLALYIITIFMIYKQEVLLSFKTLFILLIIIHVFYYCVFYALRNRGIVNKWLIYISLFLSIYLMVLLITYLRFKNYGH